MRRIKGRFLAMVMMVSCLYLSGALAGNTDLDVTFIERLPRYDYDAVKNDPDPGDTVTFQGHIKHWGDTVLPSVDYTWYIDGVQGGGGTLSDLQPGEERMVTRQWTWVQGSHQVELVVDPLDDISESSEVNNTVDDRTDGIIVGFWVEQSVYDYFHQYQADLGDGANSWEDWAQRQIRRWNDMCAAAVWPTSPQGVLDRFRLDKIVVVPDGALPLAGGLPTNTPDRNDRTVDLMWGFPTTPSLTNFYGNHSTADDTNPFFIERSLLHELGHARYLIDNYGFDVHNTGSYHSVQIFEGDTYVAGSSYMPFLAFNEVLYYNTSGGVMTGPYGFNWSPYEAAALNRIAGRRAICGNANAPCNIGEFLQELPENNHMRFVDKLGKPLKQADIHIYNVEVGRGWYGKTIDNIVDQTYITDTDGFIHLPQNPFNPGGSIIHTYGTANGVMVLRIAYDDHVWYRFQEVTDFNMAYWEGHTINAVYTMAVDLYPPQFCPPPDLAENNADDWEGWAQGFINWDSYFENDTVNTPSWSLGGASVKFVTDGGGDTYLRYPGVFEAHWDLGGAETLSISVYAENPSPYNFQKGPVIRLIDVDGNYYEYTNYENGHPNTLLNDALGEWMSLEIPLDAPESPAGGWGRTAVGSSAPDLTDIRYLEIHADTWDNGFILWVDEILFDPPLECCPSDMDGDGDVDGRDLEMSANDPSRINLATLAKDFGRVECGQSH